MPFPTDAPVPPAPGRASPTALAELCGLLDALDQLDVLNVLPERTSLSADDGVTFGRFRLIRKLGAGRFGIVFLADDPKLNRSVVVKVPQPAVLADADLRERFVREARAAARLDHPGIVSVFDAGEVRGLVYFAAGFVEGPNLAEWFQSLPGPPEPRIAAKLVAALARAVQHAHDRGVLHCDLKPANVLLDRSGDVGPGVSNIGTPRVTDFGLARLIEDDPAFSATLQVVGTPLYMAPEQARGDRQSLTAQADIFALGAMLYELLTGHPPHFGGTSNEVLARLLAHDPVRPRKLSPQIPRDLEAICLKCLEKLPDQRYASAASLADDLERFLDGRPVSARRIGPLTTLGRSVRRRPVLSFLAFATATSVATAAGLIAYYSVARYEDRLAVETARDKADAADFYASLERIRQRRTVRASGWIAANRTDLIRLAAMSVAEGDYPALRTEAAAVLTDFDLPEPRIVGERFSAHQVEFAPDGKVLALGGWFADDFGRCEIRLVDPTTGRILDQFFYPTDPVWEKAYGKPNTDGCRALAFSSDGRWLVAGTRSGWICVWDRTASDRTLVRRKATASLPDPRDEYVSGLAFTSDGRGLVAAGGTTVTLWSANRGWGLAARESGTLHGDLVRPARPGDPLIALIDNRRLRIDEAAMRMAPGDLQGFHVAAAAPENRFLVTRDQGPSKLRLFDLESRSVIGALTLPDDDRAEDGAIRSLAVSPDGILLAAAAEHAGHLKIWSLQAGRVLAARSLGGGSLRLAFAPNGAMLAITEADRTLLYDLSHSEIATEIARQKFPVRDAEITADGRRLATVAEYTGVVGQATLWADEAGAVRSLEQWPAGEPPGNNNRWQIAATSDGRTTFSAGTALHDRTAEGASEPRDSLSDLKDLRSGPDGRTWYCARGGAYRRSEGAAPTLVAGTAGAIAVAPGRTISVLGTNGGDLIRVSGAEAASDREWHLFPTKTTAIALSRDERTVVAGSGMGDVAVVDASTGAVKFRLPGAHQDTVESAAIGPQGWFATGSWDRTVRIWTADGQPVLALPQTRPATRLFWSADGRTLTVLAEGERGLRRWNLTALKRGLESLGIPSGLPDS